MDIYSCLFYFFLVILLGIIACEDYEGADVLLSTRVTSKMQICLPDGTSFRFFSRNCGLSTLMVPQVYTT